MPWEIKKLNDYISEIIQLTEKSIDFFYIILDDTFLNNFRKKIVEICKIHNFKHYEIVNDYKADAIIALEFMKNLSSNELWIFNCFHRGICCSIWEKNADSGFFLLEHCRQDRTTHGDNPSINELTNLKKDIEVAIPKKSSLPILVIIQRAKQIDEMCYKTAFYGYQSIFFYKQKSFAYSFVSHIQNVFEYNINDILGREIDFKINEIPIANFIANSKMPFMNEYEINVMQSNTIFKV
uniref:Uncharacterized protein n=1 Tax=Panagrolaimus davidi TaxID=227884 RepID=A0A914QZV9_9BILA